MTPVEILGWVAALVGTVLGLPQLIRLARTRSTAGLSLFGWQAILVLNLIWAIHGIKIGQANMIVTNLGGLVTTSIVLYLFTKDLGRRLFPVVLPSLLAVVVLVAIDLGLGSTAFGVASLVPAILANAGQIIEVVRSPSVTGVSPVFLGLGLVNQLLWLSWAVLLNEASSKISSFLLVLMIAFNLTWYLLRRAGLRAFFVRPVEAVEVAPDLAGQAEFTGQ
ncbi:MAG: PQ-loop domain-containing transporter [Propionicimonas sp.]|uniref:SemiSWEET family sugar transporter n=1 Tax=Propionicimonas sp. TaxID=1955623 RepID=UPI003D144D3D